MNDFNRFRRCITCTFQAIALLSFMAATPRLFSQQLDVLVIGSTHSYSNTESGASDVEHEQPFNPTTMVTRLQSILSQDTAISGSVNVEYEEVYKSTALTVPIGGSGTAWPYTFRCYSLIQHFMWPENKATRMANLRGEGDHVWDYIVLVEDPYVMANFPGVYAEGVKMIQNEVSNSSNPAQLILLSQWPKDDAGVSSAISFSDVAHRVGDSGGIAVAPGARAWRTYGSKDSSSNHPTPKGEYLAACSIYSKMFNRSASSSNYTYPSDGNNIANHVWTQVQAVGPNTEYSGKYTTQNAFQMEYYQGRTVDWGEGGTSTEEGFANGLSAALSNAKVASNRRGGSTSNPVDLFYSRGTDVFEANKQYNYGTRLDEGNRVHGFPMGDHKGTASTEEGQLTMRYGIDKRYYGGGSFSNGTDLGVAYSMVREDEIPLNVRGTPVRLLWSKINHFQPSIQSHRDGWHLSNELDRAVGAYLFTVLTGRCPVEAEPADNTSTAWKQWWCRKLGYETAWQMAHLTTRAPGFRVCPSSTSALTLAPGATETMTVEFVNPPQSDVTVTVSLSNSTAAIVGPKTLTFTPSNYDTPQQVIVAALPGAAASEAFNVNFSTSSTDDIYDALSDSWAYTTTRASTVSVSQTDNGTTQATALQNTPLAININAAGSNGSNTILVGPFNGSLTWSSDSVIEYTPNNDYLGSDVIVYAATVGSTQTIGCIDITVEIPNGQVNATVGDGSANEEGPDTGTFVINRVGGDTGSSLNVYFSMSGSATLTSDYTLSHGSPVTIPAGQESVTITLTPVDDSIFGERFESAVLTITEDAGYPIGAASAVVTIADNDNNAPTANAGPNQSVEWLDETTVPGLAFGEVAGNIDETTPNPETEILVNVASKTEDGILGNTTEIFTGQIYDADGQISFTEHIDDKARIWIDNVLVINNDAYGARSSTNNLNLSAGWHDIEIRISNGGGGSGPPNGQIGIGYDPAGGTTWQTLVDPGDGSFLKADGAAAGGEATMAGSANDVDGDPLTTTWSVVSSPGGSNVTFDDASALDATANFDTLGTYVLRLTVDDGLTQTTDDVTINVQLLSNTPPVTDAGTDQTITMNGTAAWSPDSLTLQGWYDASDASTITQSGGLVSEWRDKSGNSRHASQVTGANQPTTGANTMGGLNVMTLNGSSQFFDVDLDYLAGNSHSAFIVTKATTPTDIYGAANASQGANSLHVGFNGANNYRMNYWGNDFGPTLGASFNTSGGNVLNYVWIPSTSKEIFANGVSQGTSSNAGNIGTMSGGGRIGQVVNHNYYGGDIAEIIFITGTVTLEDREKMEGYLAHKWGLEADLDAAHPYKSAAPGAAGVSANLDGTVTDGEQTPTGSWSMVSGPAAVSFDDSSAIDTTVSFTQTGTYVLRLTGDDGYVQTTDDVTITVNPALPAIYASWSSGSFTHAFTDTDPSGNQDGDAHSNMMEFAMGSDPTVATGGALAVDGSAHGTPIPMEGAGDSMEFYFVRRDDHGSTGSVSYTVQFSNDLGSFTDSVVTPTFVADSSVDADYEVVKVAYPANSRFARIEVEMVP